MNLDFSFDHQIWTGTEAVTLESVRAHGTLHAHVAVALRSDINVREQAPSFGVYVGADVNFRIPLKYLPAEFVPLKPRDRVIDDKGREYTVLSVQPGRSHGATANSFKLMCRNLKLAYDLRDLVTIEEPHRELDEGRAKLVRTWQEKYRLIPARVQLESEAIAEMGGKRVSQGTFKIYIDREVSVTHENRVKWIPGVVRDPVTHALAAPDITDVRYLEVIGYHGAESISELPVVDARSTP